MASSSVGASVLHGHTQAPTEPPLLADFGEDMAFLGGTCASLGDVLDDAHEVFVHVGPAPHRILEEGMGTDVLKK